MTQLNVQAKGAVWRNGQPSLDEYPRPLLRRAQWIPLDGVWDFALDPDGVWRRPSDVLSYESRIRVPFAPETVASGIGNTGFYRACWYRREFVLPVLAPSQRLLLHFGAVDYAATVWINGQRILEHEGGYTPFSLDITDSLIDSDTQEIVVRAEDDPLDLAKPRGKQDWQEQPHSIWYPRTTGIWQSVWMEVLSATSIAMVRWTPSLERWEVGLEVVLNGARRDDLVLKVRLQAEGVLLAEDSYRVIAGEVHRRIALSDPGIDDYRNELLWSPSHPTLIAAQLELVSLSGEQLDVVSSYTALRSIGVQGDRFVLNGRPYHLRLVLDQGYWPESGLTPPDSAALRRDVELAKAMGFNGVRKHQKIEDPRYLYWADRLGLLVWEEMPSAYRYTKLSINRVAREWAQVIARDISHPCIVAWVPFNESWGVPDLPDSPAQRHYVQALYHLTKTLDCSRPVVGNDGWESVATDIVGIHDYDDEPERIARRYGSPENLPYLFRRERPGGRLLVVEGGEHRGQPIVLTEFGGIALASDGVKTWGYQYASDAKDLARQCSRLFEVVRSLASICGFCYTQFADTYQEANGLLGADRTPKFPLDDIARAVRGPRHGLDWQIEATWRERLMDSQHGHILSPEDHRLQQDR